MKATTYQSIVDKYNMHELYNNQIEMTVIGHWIESQDELPDLEALVAADDSTLTVIAEHHGWGGVKYTMIPAKSVLGKRHHGIMVDGVPTPCDRDALKVFLRRCKAGSFVYPNAVSRNLKIRMEDAYKILDACVDAGVLSRAFRVVCPRCNCSVNIYDSPRIIPDEEYCIHCDNEFSTEIENAIVIYRKNQ